MPLFEAIERESSMHTSGEVAVGAALLLAVFVQIQRIATATQAQEGQDTTSSTRKAEQIDRFRALVDAHFRGRWGVERFAAEVGLSAGQLSRLCREMLGMSSLDVVNARVVHEAERELVYRSPPCWASRTMPTSVASSASRPARRPPSSGLRRAIDWHPIPMRRLNQLLERRRSATLHSAWPSQLADQKRS